MNLRVSFVALATLATAFPATAQSDAVTIRASYTVIMDRIRPDPRDSVRTSHTLTLRLSGSRRVDEDWQARSGRFSKSTQTVKQLGGSGDDGVGSWRVLPGNKIQRRIDHPQSVTTMTITVDSGDRCRLEVAGALKPGFKEYKFRRQATGDMAFFANRRTTDHTCEVVK